MTRPNSKPDSNSIQRGIRRLQEYTENMPPLSALVYLIAFGAFIVILSRKD